MNYEECLSIRVNLVLKPYYEDYQSLLFYEELEKVKFSLSDQYFCYYNSVNNIGYTIFLIEESKHKKLALKLTEHLNSLTTISFFTFLRTWICNIQSSRTTCYRSSIFLKILALHLYMYSLI